MSIYLHTICVEPARWTPQRVSRRLEDLLPEIAASGFTDLEIYEPHLEDGNAAALSRRCHELRLRPAVLSSYLNLRPDATTDADMPALVDTVLRQIETLGFTRLRLFPGLGMKPDDVSGAARFTERLAGLAESIPQVEVLLETHDGSLADLPGGMVSMLEKLQLSNVGLLYQPTRFEAEAAVEQMAIQKRWVRHIHLQNRAPDLSFTGLGQGVVPWPRVLKELGRPVTMSVEFVPASISPVGEFDLAATLSEARRDADYIESVLAGIDHSCCVGSKS